MSSKLPSKDLKAVISRKDLVPAKEVYAFGGYHLEAGPRLITRDGERLAITPKAFDVLLHLVRNPGRVIEKDEFFQTLWPGSVVEEANLTQTIFVLRKTLREKETGQSYISTIPGRGYSFICPVAPIDEPLPLEVLTGSPADTLFPRKITWWTLAVTGICVCVGSFAWYWLSRGKPSGPPRMQSLTAYPGTESWPALSPDGSKVAFVWDDGGRRNPSLYVLRIGTDEPVRLTHGSNAETTPAWSPDGKTIAFVRAGPGSASVYTVDAETGQEQLVREIYPMVTAQYGRYLDWSPDGKRLAVTLKKTMEEAGRLVLIPVEGPWAESAPLTNPPTHAHCDSNPVYSPDGRFIAFSRTERYSVSDIYIAPCKRDGTPHGPPRRITFDNQRVEGLTWTEDSSEIVFASNRTGRHGLSRVRAAGGSVEPVGIAGDDAMYPSASKSKGKLVYAKLSVNQNIWRLSFSPTGGAPDPPVKMIASTKIQNGPQYSPDGKRIAFSSDRSGSMEIWTSAADGSGAVRLTSVGGALAGLPRWSPDGRMLAFDGRTDSGYLSIFVVPASGGSARPVTSATAEDNKASWSHDGRWIYFSSNRTGRWQIWKVPVNGGEAIQLTRLGGNNPFESVDRRFVYYTKERISPAIWRVPVLGGEEQPVLTQPRPKTWSYWALSSDGIFFLTQPDDSVFEGSATTTVQFFDFESRKTTPIANIDGDIQISTPGLAVSPDGRFLLYPQIDESKGDLVLLEGLK